MKFVDVILPFGDLEANHPLTYRVPPHLENVLHIGDPVVVPFRKGKAEGFILQEASNPGIPTKEILEKNKKLSPLPLETMTLAKWISERYLSPLWEALRSFAYPNIEKPISTMENFSGHPVPKLPFALTEEQKNSAQPVINAISEGRHEIFLLHGITGSGKTEVYLACTQSALEAGKQVLMLVPEIPLSFQVARRFREIFGELVVVLHSGLSTKEKEKEQVRFARGKAKIVVGPRMALFAPFKNLGLIIMDEEHDSSYKQENHPRYQARVLARKIALQKNAVLLFGSATPSLESYYSAKTGEFSLLTLQNRYEARPLPFVQIVDLRTPNGKQAFPFSQVLVEALRETKAKKEQAILFLNRRGFSPAVFCLECGLVFECPRCSISLTFHLAQKKLLCHYCNFQKAPPSSCPRCGSLNLTYRGFGTQRLEEEIHKHLPGAKVLRLDRDTTARRGSTKEIVEAFLNHEADILIGTQMVAKGFDFPNVSLVGILNADQHLHFPDFRAGEKTFQLLAQVAGRAGRRDIEGKVILQTFDPEHPVIQAASKHDYLLFYEEEIQNRKKAFYPPFCHLTNFILTNSDETLLEEELQKLEKFLKDAGIAANVEILGPSPCPIPKINKNFRWHFLLKSEAIKPLLELAKHAFVWFKKNNKSKTRFTVDVNPMNLL
jgi:primosomal protein N' (replication factor Y)